MKMKNLVPVLILFSIVLSLPYFCFAQTAGAPLPPQNANAQVKDNDVIISWTPPVDTSVVGFNVYRKVDANGSDFAKVNDKLVIETVYRDRSVKEAVSYAYLCKSVNSDGIESEPGNICGAPKMTMNTSATVIHMGKTVRIATPGDVIKYDIDFANRGYGVAKNVIIVYAIPKGTTFIAGTAKCPQYKVKIQYFDDKSAAWADEVAKVENVSKVRFSVLEEVRPAKKDLKMDNASLKVMVNY